MEKKEIVQPDPPVVGKVTYHTIELYWREHDHAYSYIVQEKDTSSSGGSFVTVYEGSDSHCLCTGLKPSTEYHYRLRVNNNEEVGALTFSQWSSPVIVSTTRHVMSCDNLHRAINNNDVDTVISILETDPQYLDIPDIHGLSPLMSASKKGRLKIVEHLLSLGANVDYCNTAGKTSMMEASYHGHNDCISLLHNAGALWSQRDHSGMSVLHWAVDGEQIKTIEYLLNQGIPVDDVVDFTVSGWTPLLRLAATNGNTIIAQKLISHGADINKRDSQGQTPLMLACLGGHKELVGLLLKYNCCTSFKSKHNKSAVDFALSFGREDIVEMIKMATRRGSIGGEGQEGNTSY